MDLTDESIASSYKVLNNIGKGSYGQVFKAWDL
jgi:serine/threonine protein kinase